ncbi:class I SAM-dependent rRNA methyltransferase [Exiguobacterium flavidum]|uniref:class I SAM-dependent rRNA methyltransferase n=1 Tax=Exiguobacterium flavidum TaxID=2184695 RepID=UPI000DF795BF|nr:class I SAM-dependent methyltransferase [Exiguobacterium flavidum]
MLREIYPLVVKDAQVARFRDGYPFIFKEALTDSRHVKEAGALLHLRDEAGDYIATGYHHGQQEKGLGWVLSTDETEEIDTDFFKRKIETALDRRDDFFENDDLDGFRVFNGEGDGIGGLTIDCYDHHYMITFKNEGLFSFKREILAALESLIHFKSIYEKRAFQIDGQPVKGDDFLAGERGDFPEALLENGVELLYDLDGGMRTGLNLAERDARRFVRENAEGKTMVSLFADTGTYALEALLGGASSATSVDFATRSRNKTLEQLKHHGIEANHEFVTQDAFDYIGQADKATRFDLVVLTPPSLVKTRTRTFRAEIDLPALLQQVVYLTNRGGRLVVATDCPLFDLERLAQMVQSAFKKTRQKGILVAKYESPADFPLHPLLPEAGQKTVVFEKK